MGGPRERAIHASCAVPGMYHVPQMPAPCFFPLSRPPSQQGRSNICTVMGNKRGGAFCFYFNGIKRIIIIIMMRACRSSHHAVRTDVALNVCASQCVPLLASHPLSTCRKQRGHGTHHSLCQGWSSSILFSPRATNQMRQMKEGSVCARSPSMPLLSRPAGQHSPGRSSLPLSPHLQTGHS